MHPLSTAGASGSEIPDTAPSEFPELFALPSSWDFGAESVQITKVIYQDRQAQYLSGRLHNFQTKQQTWNPTSHGYAISLFRMRYHVQNFLLVDFPS